jgi:hypothetical protein
MICSRPAFVAVCSSVLLFAAPASLAQTQGGADDALVTDRPDSVESASVVGRYTFQIETGVEFGSDAVAGVTTRSFSTPTLLRFGVTDRVELRLEWALYRAETRTAEAVEHGFTDLDLGVKAKFADNEGVVPDFAVLFHLGIPAGVDRFSSAVIEPRLKLLLAWALPKGFALGANLGVDVPQPNDEGKRYARALYAVSVAFEIPRTDERLTVFLESAGQVPTRKRAPLVIIAGGGFAIRVTKHLQLDAAARAGLTDDAPDITASAGVSWRYR